MGNLLSYLTPLLTFVIVVWGFTSCKHSLLNDRAQYKTNDSVFELSEKKVYDSSGKRISWPHTGHFSDVR